LRDDDWSSPTARAIGAFIAAPGKAGAPLLLLANPHADDVAFVLPAGEWRLLIDTARRESVSGLQAAASYPLAARSLVLLEARA